MAASSRWGRGGIRASGSFLTAGAGEGQIQQHCQQAGSGIATPQQETTVEGREACRQQAGQSKGDGAIVEQQLPVGAGPQLHHLYGGEGHHIGIAHPGREHRHLPHQISGTEHGHHRLLPVRRVGPHLGEPALDQHKTFSLILLQEQHLLGGHIQADLAG
jgi:hypothetical protein